MQSICEITGITLPELLNGARQNPSTERTDSILLILALWDREKLAKSKTLNCWFACGLVTFLTAILSAEILSRVETCLLVCFGIFFHCLGFYHNNRDPKLTDGEKAILAAFGDTVTMSHPEELLTFARKHQNVSAAQYKTAFREICEKLAEHERVFFAMVGNEYSIGAAPSIWHAGIAVTQERIFLCGETVAGRFMTRTVMDIYDKTDILSVQYTNSSILLKTAQTTVTIKGENISQLVEDFKNAVRPQK